ncbi:MAG TPA: helix-turn-helix domain-containing protein [Conexibacter sp.]|nr:helix-turn-helix domain-containing protein [Conexibacter sp.]
MPTTASATRARTVRLLDYDPELAASVRPERRDEARARATATLIDVPRGPWDVEALVEDRRAVYGLLLLDGLVTRTVRVDDIAAAQLLGRGDLVLPHEPPGGLVTTTVGWTVREPAPVALLDDAFLLSVRRWPELVAALFQRVAMQSNRRGVQAALGQLPRVEDRVHALLWFLAERWGRMTPLGVVLPMRLTHETLGQLVGAKRPTVTLAMKALEADGRVHRRPDGGWLLARAGSAAPAFGDERAPDLGLRPEAAAGVAP